MISYEQMLKNNRLWAESMKNQDPSYFKRLAQEQHPDYLYIGCSDSRMPAHELMGVEPGSVFVHRNIANLIPNTDLNSTAVIEYAVRHLRVKHIIVCGHYGCGGVKAAMQPEDLGLLNPWLRNIRDVFRLHKFELDTILTDTAKFDKLVELNVREQCINAIKSAAVQLSYVERRTPTVHGWVFDFKTGLITDLDIDFRRILGEIQKIYNLTGKALA